MDMNKQVLGAVSSGSDGCPQSGDLDERKRKRMLSNRESARRSRVKKLKHMDDLIGQAAQLKLENDQMLQNITATKQSYMYVAAERVLLQAEAMALTARLQSLNEFFYIFAEHVNDLSMDCPEIPAGFLEPWQLVSIAAVHCFSKQVPLLNSHSAFNRFLQSAATHPKTELQTSQLSKLKENELVSLSRQPSGGSAHLYQPHHPLHTQISLVPS